MSNITRRPQVKLPANPEDAKALEYTREMIERLRQGEVELFGIPLFVLDVEAGGKFAREFIKKVGQQHVENRAIFIDYAREGCPISREALHELWREMASRGEVCHHLNAFIADVQRGAVKRRLPAKQRATNLIRDIAVAALIVALTRKFPIEATRGAVQRRKASACSIIGDAGIGVSEDAANKIWDRFSKML